MESAGADRGGAGADIDAEFLSWAGAHAKALFAAAQFEAEPVVQRVAALHLGVLVGELLQVLVRNRSELYP